MIDFHCHILPGIDDGPADISESRDMAAMLASFGFSQVCCTPHLIRGNYNVEPSGVRFAAAGLQERLDKEGIGIKVHPGMEYYIDEFFTSALEDPLTLCGSGMVLFEAPVQADPGVLKNAVFQIVRRRLAPLLAHPERCPLLLLPQKKWFSRKAEGNLAEDLREMGCLFQGNIGSFAGIYGNETMKTAISYLERGLYSQLGSDGHSASHLDRILKKGLKKIEEVAGKEEMKKLFDLAVTAHGKPIAQGKG